MPAVRTASAEASATGGAHVDVFLSHNRRDRAIVERIAERLKRSGLEPWLDKWSQTPGGEWQEELGRGVEAPRACAVFIGPNDLGAWGLQELAFALDRSARERDFRVLPVLLPACANRLTPRYSLTSCELVRGSTSAGMTASARCRTSSRRTRACRPGRRFRSSPGRGLGHTAGCSHSARRTRSCSSAATGRGSGLWKSSSMRPSSRWSAPPAAASLRSSGRGWSPPCAPTRFQTFGAGLAAISRQLRRHRGQLHGYLTQSPVESLIPLQNLDKIRDSPFVFVGYRVRDWSVRVFLQRVWGEHPVEARSWAFNPVLDFLEHQLWDHLGVKVVETPMTEFLNELERELGRIAPVDLER